MAAMNHPSVKASILQDLANGALSICFLLATLNFLHQNEKLLLEMPSRNIKTWIHIMISYHNWYCTFCSTPNVAFTTLSHCTKENQHYHIFFGSCHPKWWCCTYQKFIWISCASEIFNFSCCHCCASSCSFLSSWRNPSCFLGGYDARSLQANM